MPLSEEAKERRRARNKQWKIDNAEAYKEQQRQYRIENADQIKERQRQWVAENQERVKEYYRQHRVENLEHIKERTRQYYAQNVEHIKERTRKWHRDNPDKHNAISRNRHARKRGAEGVYTEDDILNLFIEQEGIRAYCGVSLERGYHVDHVIPLSRGGSNWPDNLALACQPCNDSKGSKLLEEWKP